MDEITYEGSVFKKPNHVIIKSKYHGVISRAVKKGTLHRLPCEICGDKNSKAHHEVYADDYKIRWLCHKHHKIIHNMFINGKMEKLTEYLKVQVKLSKDQDYALNLYQAKLSKMNLKKSKADLIVKLAMIGLLQENELLNEYPK